jgi:hypothetical protein
VQTQPPPASVMVKIIEPKSDLESLSDVLLGSLGLAGVFVLGAVVLAAVFAGVLFLWRSRSSGPAESGDDLHIVP